MFIYVSVCQLAEGFCHNLYHQQPLREHLAYPGYGYGRAFRKLPVLYAVGILHVQYPGILPPVVCQAVPADLSRSLDCGLGGFSGGPKQRPRYHGIYSLLSLAHLVPLYHLYYAVVCRVLHRALDAEKMEDPHGMVLLRVSIHVCASLFYSF